MSEHQEQVAVVSWFKLQYADLSGCIMSIPNGAHLAGTPKQRAQKMAKMKREGFKAGVSDLFIAVPRGPFSGMWIEMKDQGKTKSSVSEAQQDHLIEMTNQGYYAVWCAGFDRVKAEIDFYMAH